MRRLFVLLLLAAGCSKDIQKQYDDAKAYAMEKADSVPSRWQADAYLLLAPQLVSDMLSTGLQTALDETQPIDVRGQATLTPKATVRSITLNEKASCDDCIGITAKLGGKLGVVAGKLKDEVPFEVTLGASLEFKTRDEGGRRALDVTLRSVDSFAVSFSKSIALNLDGVLENWGKTLVTKVPPYDMGLIGGEDLGILDLRLLPEGQGLRVEMLTDAAHGVVLKQKVALPEKGFVVAISEGTLTDIARREAFGVGELALDIYAEPTSLDFEGDHFTMGLRLWRLAGSGWWRDYAVQGSAKVSGKLLRLTPTQADEISASDGAELADPLATLGKSLILDTIVESAGQALPIHSTTKMDSLGFTLTVRTAQGQGDALVLAGDAALYKPKVKATTPHTAEGSSKSEARRGGSKR